jgi:hypothetical protein
MYRSTELKSTRRSYPCKRYLAKPDRSTLIFHLQANSMNRVIASFLTTGLIYLSIFSTAIGIQPIEASIANVYIQAQLPNQAVKEQISPFDLTYLAYQGNLKQQGIPSYGALIDGIAFGKVTAEKVMQAAVRANFLPEQTLADASYRSALQRHLYNLIVTD